MFEGAAAFLQRIGNIGQRLFGVRAQMGGQPLRGLVQRGLRAGGQGQELEGPVALFGGGHLWRLFKDHMGIRAADPERVDPGPTRPFAARPVCQAVIHAEGAVVEINGRIGLFEVQAGRQLAVMQRQGGLDQAGDARGGVQMADIRLHAADAGKAGLCSGAAEGFGQGCDFDRVAQIGAGPVAFDVIHRVGGHAADLHRFGNAGRLTFDRGGKVARLGSPVVVDGASPDDGPYVIAIGNRVFKAAKHDGARAGSEDRSLTAMIKGMAHPVGRENFALLVDVAAVLRQFDRHATGQGHVAFAVQQGLGGVMDSDERG